MNLFNFMLETNRARAEAIRREKEQRAHAHESADDTEQETREAAIPYQSGRQLDSSQT